MNVLQLHHGPRNLGESWGAFGPGPCLLKYEFASRPMYRKQFLVSYQDVLSSHKPVIFFNELDSQRYCPEGDLLPQLPYEYSGLISTMTF